MFWTVVLALFCYEVAKDLLYAIIKVFARHIRWVSDKEEKRRERVSPYAGRDYDIEKAESYRKAMIGFGANDDY